MSAGGAAAEAPSEFVIGDEVFVVDRNGFDIFKAKVIGRSENFATISYFSDKSVEEISNMERVFRTNNSSVREIFESQERGRKLLEKLEKAEEDHIDRQESMRKPFAAAEERIDTKTKRKPKEKEVRVKQPPVVVSPFHIHLKKNELCSTEKSPPPLLQLSSPPPAPVSSLLLPPPPPPPAPRLSRPRKKFVPVPAALLKSNIKQIKDPLPKPSIFSLNDEITQEATSIQCFMETTSTEEKWTMKIIF